MEPRQPCRPTGRPAHCMDFVHGRQGIPPIEGCRLRVYLGSQQDQLGVYLGVHMGSSKQYMHLPFALPPVSVVGTPGHSTLKKVDLDRDESGTGAWYG
jgi:hypothetical protein